jgi:hypothetical protein
VCELAHIRRMAAEADRPLGLTADDILDEVRRYFALSPKQQTAEMGHFYASLTDEERAELQAIEDQYRRLL